MPMVNLGIITQDHLYYLCDSVVKKNSCYNYQAEILKLNEKKAKEVMENKRRNNNFFYSLAYSGETKTWKVIVTRLDNAHLQTNNWGKITHDNL